MGPGDYLSVLSQGLMVTGATSGDFVSVLSHGLLVSSSSPPPPPPPPTEDETVAAIFVHDGKLTVITELAEYIDDELRFHLCKNDLTPDENTDLADVVEADFAGYTPFNTTWGSVLFDSAGRATRTGIVITWNCFGGGVTNVIFGFYVTNNGVALQFIHRFAAPRSMAVAGDEISILPTILVGNLAPP